MSLASSPFSTDLMAEAFLWPPSFLTADPPAGSPAGRAEEGSPLPPPAFGPKAGAELPWRDVEELCHASAEESDEEDAFYGMDWMAEKVDLSGFDLDSLIGSCSSDEPPSSPEDLMASLESPMELSLLPMLDPLLSLSEPLLPLSKPLLSLSEPLLPLSKPLPLSEPLLPLPKPLSISEPFPLSEPLLPAPVNQEIALPHPASPLSVPEPETELEIKSEPVSPDPAPLAGRPPTPTFALDLGSEVDVSGGTCDSAGPPLPPGSKVPRIVLSLSPTRILLVLAPKEETTIIPADRAAHSLPDPLSTPARPHRSKPYSMPPTTASPSRTRRPAGDGAPPRAEKKLKKMEQNKTAATRYRQKKRAEQEGLDAQCEALERTNQALAERADSIAKEIQYLKDLMEEVRQAKGHKS